MVNTKVNSLLHMNTVDDYNDKLSSSWTTLLTQSSGSCKDFVFLTLNPTKTADS